jgi:hypothetical protein
LVVLTHSEHELDMGFAELFDMVGRTDVTGTTLHVASAGR